MSTVKQVREFFSDVGMEMRKSSWPSRQELTESTVVVIVSLGIIGGFVFLSDLLLMTVIKLVF